MVIAIRTTSASVFESSVYQPNSSLFYVWGSSSTFGGEELKKNIHPQKVGGCLNRGYGQSLAPSDPANSESLFVIWELLFLLYFVRESLKFVHFLAR